MSGLKRTSRHPDSGARWLLEVVVHIEIDFEFMVQGPALRIELAHDRKGRLILPRYAELSDRLRGEFRACSYMRSLDWTVSLHRDELAPGTPDASAWRVTREVVLTPGQALSERRWRHLVEDLARAVSSDATTFDLIEAAASDMPDPFELFRGTE